MLTLNVDFRIAVSELAEDKEVSCFDIFLYAFEWYYGSPPSESVRDAMESVFGRVMFHDAIIPIYVRAYCHAAYAVLEA